MKGENNCNHLYVQTHKCVDISSIQFALNLYLIAQ